MRLRALGLMTILASMLVVAACGRAGESCEGCQEFVPPGVTARSGNLLVIASPRLAPAGQTIKVTVSVSGPADYETGCVHPVTIWALNPAGAQIWYEQQPILDCFAETVEHVAAGQSASFTQDWPVAAGTPAGRYTIHGLFMFHLPAGAGMRVRENLPPVSVEITG